jgi:hypothetical protein
MKPITQESFEKYLIRNKNEILAVSASFNFNSVKEPNIPNFNFGLKNYLSGTGIIKFAIKLADNTEKEIYVTHTTFNGFGLDENAEYNYFVEYAKDFLLELNNSTGLKIELLD